MAETQNAVGRVALEGELTIYTAAEMKGRMLSPLQLHDETEFDLAAVSEVDTAGLQLMIAAKLEAGKLGKALRFVAHSPAVVEMLELTNMASFFGDPLLLQTAKGE